MRRDSGIYCDMPTFDTVEQSHSARKLTSTRASTFLVVSSARDDKDLSLFCIHSVSAMENGTRLGSWIQNTGFEISPRQVFEFVTRSWQKLCASKRSMLMRSKFSVEKVLLLRTSRSVIC
jgi:hypothetical protein